MWSKKFVSDKEIIEAANNCLTMSSAAAQVKLKLSTFKRRAEALNVYAPNQGGMNTTRESKIVLEDILNGKYPSYDSGDLKRRLLKAGIKENKCEDPGCIVKNEWNNKPIICEMHHVDGDRTNQKLENLMFLCPNCHSQTDSFSRIKNILSEQERKLRILKRNKFGNQEYYNTLVKTKWDESQQEYIPLIIGSDIDFSSFGWVNEVAKILNRPPQKVNLWMKRIMPEFYKECCFKRKKS